MTVFADAKRLAIDLDVIEFNKVHVLLYDRVPVEITFELISVVVSKSNLGLLVLTGLQIKGEQRITERVLVHHLISERDGVFLSKGRFPLGLFLCDSLLPLGLVLGSSSLQRGLIGVCFCKNFPEHKFHNTEANELRKQGGIQPMLILADFWSFSRSALSRSKVP